MDDTTTLAKLAEHAAKGHGGHFTIMKFSTNWRVAFGTIGWEFSPMVLYDTISKMPEGKTLAEAAEHAIRDNVSLWER